MAVDENYYPTIARDILKMNSIFLGKAFNIEEQAIADDNESEKSLLFDPIEVFNIISNNNRGGAYNEEFISDLKLKRKTMSPLNKKVTYSCEELDEKEEVEADNDANAIKHKKVPMDSSDSLESSGSSDIIDNNFVTAKGIPKNIIEEANTLLSLYSNDDDNPLFDEMLTKLEISMEYEIAQIHNYFVTKKAPFINELERRCKNIYNK